MPPTDGLFSPRGVSQRLLTVLQLTRMALVFTAVADSLCELLLAWGVRGLWPPTALVGPLVVISVGLYGFGMSLNDIIDRRRDAQIASTRPLPSGRIGLITAHVICIGLIIAAIVAGFLFAGAYPYHGWLCLVFLVLAGGLITFYDFAGKYLVGPGLVSLGLIRMAHCLIAAPNAPVIWHPLWLLNHVTVLSTVAYTWEEKRPTLTKAHWWGVLGSVAGIDVLSVAASFFWHRDRHPTWSTFRCMSLSPALLLPIAAMLAFILVGAYVYRTTTPRRVAGQKLMLYGLLWLIVYDASFATAYAASPWAGAMLLALLPLAWLSVQLMRGWSKLLVAAHKPQYQIATGKGEETRGHGDTGTRGAKGP